MSNSREFVMCNVLWTDYQPADWVIQPVWQVFKIGRGRVIAETELNPNGAYPVYSSQTKNNGCLGFIDTYDFDCTQITWTTDGANAGTVFLRRGKHNCTNVCGTLLPLKPDRHDIHFYTFFLSYVTQFYKRPDTNGAKIMNGEMAAIRLAVPPVYEQRQIAAYLNRETAKIDKLIAKQQKLITLLLEKRQAVISQAVTKGLDPAVKMKDSGVEWLGEIPVHWSKTKIKWNCSTTSGGTPDSKNIEAFYDGQIPWLRTLDLNDSVLETAEVYITEEALKATACKMLPKDTLLVAMYGGSGTIGKNARLGFASTCNQAICAILPSGKISPNFLHFYLKYYRPFWMVDAVGTRKDPNINQDQVRNLEFPLPSLGEQEEIGEFIEREINKIDKLKTKAQGSIELLKEHRQALITAAVTGKIDVRGLVTDEEVAALDSDPVLETTEEGFESEVAEADYITEEE